MAERLIGEPVRHRRGGRTEILYEFLGSFGMIVVQSECCKTYLKSPAELAAKEYLVTQLYVS